MCCPVLVCVHCAWWCLVCCVLCSAWCLWWCLVWVCCVCLVSVVSVCGAAWHAENPVCKFQTPPCVRSKRFRVYRQNARMMNTCRCFARTHGSVLNVHTEAFGTYRRGACLSLLSSSLSLVLSSFSVPSFSFSSKNGNDNDHVWVCFLLPFSSLFPLLSSHSSLSATMTMITRPVGSLWVHTALTCLSVRVPALRSIPCVAIMFASCKEQLSWHNCASLVPLGMKWACICAGNG